MERERRRYDDIVRYDCSYDGKNRKDLVHLKHEKITLKNDYMILDLRVKIINPLCLFHYLLPPHCNFLVLKLYFFDQVLYNIFNLFSCSVWNAWLRNHIVQSKTIMCHIFFIALLPNLLGEVCIWENIWCWCSW